MATRHLYVCDDDGNELWRINPADPASTTSPSGKVGDLPSGLVQPFAMTSHGGHLYVCDDDGNELWRINPADPASTTSPYGKVGNLPSGLLTPHAMTSHGGHLYVCDDDGNELWRINPADPASTTSPYGKVGDLPSGLGGPTAMTSHGGHLYVCQPFGIGSRLWRINPAAPASTTSPYGKVGDLPSGLNDPQAMTSHNDDLYATENSPEQLWRINPADPGDTSGDFGLGGLLAQRARGQPWHDLAPGARGGPLHRGLHLAPARTAAASASAGRADGDLSVQWPDAPRSEAGMMVVHAPDSVYNVIHTNHERTQPMTVSTPPVIAILTPCRRPDRARRLGAVRLRA